MSLEDNDVNTHLYEVPTSWYDIVIEAGNRLKEVDPDYTIIQIKEKFGGLRYYYGTSEGLSEAHRERMKEIIDEAEEAVNILEAVAKQSRELDQEKQRVWNSEGGSL